MRRKISLKIKKAYPSDEEQLWFAYFGPKQVKYSATDSQLCSLVNTLPGLPVLPEKNVLIQVPNTISSRTYLIQLFHLSDPFTSGQIDFINNVSGNSCEILSSQKLSLFFSPYIIRLIIQYFVIFSSGDIKNRETELEQGLPVILLGPKLPSIFQGDIQLLYEKFFSSLIRQDFTPNSLYSSIFITTETIIKDSTSITKLHQTAITFLETYFDKIMTSITELQLQSNELVCLIDFFTDLSNYPEKIIHELNLTMIRVVYLSLLLFKNIKQLYGKYPFSIIRKLGKHIFLAISKLISIDETISAAFVQDLNNIYIINFPLYCFDNGEFPDFQQHHLIYHEDQTISSRAPYRIPVQQFEPFSLQFFEHNLDEVESIEYNPTIENFEVNVTRQPLQKKEKSAKRILLSFKKSEKAEEEIHFNNPIPKETFSSNQFDQTIIESILDLSNVINTLNSKSLVNEILRRCLSILNDDEEYQWQRPKPFISLSIFKIVLSLFLDMRVDLRVASITVSDSLWQILFHPSFFTIQDNEKIRLQLNDTMHIEHYLASIDTFKDELFILLRLIYSSSNFYSQKIVEYLISQISITDLNTADQICFTLNQMLLEDNIKMEKSLISKNIQQMSKTKEQPNQSSNFQKTDLSDECDEHEIKRTNQSEKITETPTTPQKDEKLNKTKNSVQPKVLEKITKIEVSKINTAQEDESSDSCSDSNSYSYSSSKSDSNTSEKTQFKESNIAEIESNSKENSPEMDFETEIIPPEKYPIEVALSNSLANFTYSLEKIGNPSLITKNLFIFIANLFQDTIICESLLESDVFFRYAFSSMFDNQIRPFFIHLLVKQLSKKRTENSYKNLFRMIKFLLRKCVSKLPSDNWNDLLFTIFDSFQPIIQFYNTNFDSIYVKITNLNTWINSLYEFKNPSEVKVVESILKCIIKVVVKNINLRTLLALPRPLPVFSHHLIPSILDELFYAIFEKDEKTHIKNPNALILLHQCTYFIPEYQKYFSFIRDISKKYYANLVTLSDSKFPNFLMNYMKNSNNYDSPSFPIMSELLQLIFSQYLTPSHFQTLLSPQIKSEDPNANDSVGQNEWDQIKLKFLEKCSSQKPTIPKPSFAYLSGGVKNTGIWLDHVHTNNLIRGYSFYISFCITELEETNNSRQILFSIFSPKDQYLELFIYKNKLYVNFVYSDESKSFRCRAHHISFSPYEWYSIILSVDSHSILIALNGKVIIEHKEPHPEFQPQISSECIISIGNLIHPDVFHDYKFICEKISPKAKIYEKVSEMTLVPLPCFISNFALFNSSFSKEVLEAMTEQTLSGESSVFDALNQISAAIDSHSSQKERSKLKNRKSGLLNSTLYYYGDFSAVTKIGNEIRIPNSSCAEILEATMIGQFSKLRETLKHRVHSNQDGLLELLKSIEKTPENFVYLFHILKNISKFSEGRTFEVLKRNGFLSFMLQISTSCFTIDFWNAAISWFKSLTIFETRAEVMKNILCNMFMCLNKIQGMTIQTTSIFDIHTYFSQVVFPILTHDVELLKIIGNVKLFFQLFHAIERSPLTNKDVLIKDSMKLLFNYLYIAYDSEVQGALYIYILSEKSISILSNFFNMLFGLENFTKETSNLLSKIKGSILYFYFNLMIQHKKDIDFTIDQWKALSEILFTKSYSHLIIFEILTFFADKFSYTVYQSFIERISKDSTLSKLIVSCKYIVPELCFSILYSGNESVDFDSKSTFDFILKIMLVSLQDSIEIFDSFVNYFRLLMIVFKFDATNFIRQLINAILQSPSFSSLPSKSSSHFYKSAFNFIFMIPRFESYSCNLELLSLFGEKVPENYPSSTSIHLIDEILIAPDYAKSIPKSLRIDSFSSDSSISINFNERPDVKKRRDTLQDTIDRSRIPLRNNNSESDLHSSIERYYSVTPLFSPDPHRKGVYLLSEIKNIKPPSFSIQHDVSNFSFDFPSDDQHSESIHRENSSENISSSDILLHMSGLVQNDYSNIDKIKDFESELGFHFGMRVNPDGTWVDEELSLSFIRSLLKNSSEYIKKIIHNTSVSKFKLIDFLVYTIMINIIRKPENVQEFMELIKKLCEKITDSSPTVYFGDIIISLLNYSSYHITKFESESSYFINSMTQLFPEYFADLVKQGLNATTVSENLYQIWLHSLTLYSNDVTSYNFKLLENNKNNVGKESKLNLLKDSKQSSKIIRNMDKEIIIRFEEFLNSIFRFQNYSDFSNCLQSQESFVSLDSIRIKLEFPSFSSKLQILEDKPPNEYFSKEYILVPTTLMLFTTSCKTIAIFTPQKLCFGGKEIMWYDIKFFTYNKNLGNIEFFSRLNNSSYCLNFTAEHFNQIIRFLEFYVEENIRPYQINSKIICRDWTSGKIDTLDMILLLNSTIGNSFNTINHYPILPYCDSMMNVSSYKLPAFPQGSIASVIKSNEVSKTKPIDIFNTENHTEFLPEFYLQPDKLKNIILPTEWQNPIIFSHEIRQNLETHDEFISKWLKAHFNLDINLPRAPRPVIFDVKHAIIQKQLLSQYVFKGKNISIISGHVSNGNIRLLMSNSNVFEGISVVGDFLKKSSLLPFANLDLGFIKNKRAKTLWLSNKHIAVASVLLGGLTIYKLLDISTQEKENMAKSDIKDFHLLTTRKTKIAEFYYGLPVEEMIKVNDHIIVRNASTIHSISITKNLSKPRLHQRGRGQTLVQKGIEMNKSTILHSDDVFIDNTVIDVCKYPIIGMAGNDEMKLFAILMNNGNVDVYNVGSNLLEASFNIKIPLSPKNISLALFRQRLFTVICEQNITTFDFNGNIISHCDLEDIPKVVSSVSLSSVCEILITANKHQLNIIDPLKCDTLIKDTHQQHISQLVYDKEQKTIYCFKKGTYTRIYLNILPINQKIH